MGFISTCLLCSSKKGYCMFFAFFLNKNSHQMSTWVSQLWKNVSKLVHQFSCTQSSQESFEGSYSQTAFIFCIWARSCRESSEDPWEQPWCHSFKPCWWTAWRWNPFRQTIVQRWYQHFQSCSLHCSPAKKVVNCYLMIQVFFGNRTFSYTPIHHMPVCHSRLTIFRFAIWAVSPYNGG